MLATTSDPIKLARIMAAALGIAFAILLVGNSVTLAGTPPPSPHVRCRRAPFRDEGRMEGCFLGTPCSKSSLLVLFVDGDSFPWLAKRHDATTTGFEESFDHQVDLSPRIRLFERLREHVAVALGPFIPKCKITQ